MISRHDVGIWLQEAFKDLELRFQSERTILAKSVETEVQTKLAAEERDVQRALEAAIAHDDPQRRCERHEKKIQELQEELLNIREDLDNCTDMVNALNTKHMSTNDELQEAKKAAINSILYPICKMIVMQMDAADFLSFVCSSWKDILQIT